MELYELHVLERAARAERHREAVAGTCNRVRRLQIHLPPWAGADHGRLPMELLERAVREAVGDEPGEPAVLHDEARGGPFVVEGHALLHELLPRGLHERETRTVAREVRARLPHPAEGSVEQLPLLVPRGRRGRIVNVFNG